MRKKGVTPDVISSNAAISACFDDERSQMRKKGLTPDVISSNAAISACPDDESGQMRKKGVRGQKREKGLTPDVISPSADIPACIHDECGQMREASLVAMPSAVADELSGRNVSLTPAQRRKQLVRGTAPACGRKQRLPQKQRLQQRSMRYLAEVDADGWTCGACSHKVHKNHAYCTNCGTKRI
eukprot:3284062-Karenia_brevis.AAC.1